MKFDPDFTKAISLLPSEEKDKLILRLLKHDLALANRLRFELLCNDSIEDRRKAMEERIEKDVARMTRTYYSPGYLLMEMRGLSGMITEHVKITKDKRGEVSLNIQMLNDILRQNNDNISRSIPRKKHTLCTYIVARAFKILLLIKSLHEDYFVEFESELRELGQLIGGNHDLMSYAINNGLDVNWLINAEIPNNIAIIHKQVREEGLLR